MTSRLPLSSSDAITCAVCGATTSVELDDVVDPMSGERFAVRRCPVCDHGQTSPQPTDLAAYYPPTYHGGRHGFTARWAVRRRLRLLAAAVRRPPGRLVDIGCGDGDFLLAARARGWQVAGTELDPARDRAAGLRVERDARELRDLRPVDVVTMWHSLEHMAEPAATVATATELLAEGGTLLVAVPDAGGWQARATGPAWLHLDVPRHLQHFTTTSLTRLLTDQGLAVERRWHQEFEYDAVGWSQSWLNRLTGRPNQFFDAITGRPVQGGARARAGVLAAGSVLTAAAVPLVWAGAVAHRGGTLVVAAARPRRSPGSGDAGADGRR